MSFLLRYWCLLWELGFLSALVMCRVEFMCVAVFGVLVLQDC